MGGCFWLFLQTQKGNTYFTELAERAEYGSYDYRFNNLRFKQKQDASGLSGADVVASFVSSEIMKCRLLK